MRSDLVRMRYMFFQAMGRTMEEMEKPMVAVYPGRTFAMVAAWRPAIIPKTIAGPIVDPAPG